MKIFLTDNGSLRPAAVFSLRKLARQLGEALGEEVSPASLLHTNRISAGELEGLPAPILETCLQEALEAGESQFCIIPLFFGPSRAITEYLPAVKSRLLGKYGAFDLQVAPCLVSPDKPETVAAVGRLVADGIRETLAEPKESSVGIILVDHGTPEPRVNAVREAIGNYLKTETEVVGPPFQTASMERREEPEYDFNEPLLEKALQSPLFENHLVVVSMLFLQAGRHAGPGGDVETICRESLVDHPDRSFVITPLVGEHPGLVAILKKRFQERAQT